MSRHDGRLTAAGDAILDAAELLQALGARAGLSPDERSIAIARYLSGDDGWREASRLLGGAFAGSADAGAKEEDGEGLSGRKDA